MHSARDGRCEVAPVTEVVKAENVQLPKPGGGEMRNQSKTAERKNQLLLSQKDIQLSFCSACAKPAKRSFK